MLSKKILILFVVVLLGGAGIVFNEYRETIQESQKYIRLQLKSDQIQSVYSADLQIRKSAVGYTVNELPADDQSVNELFDELASAQFEVVAISENQALSFFSPENLSLDVEIDQDVKLKISQKKNFEGHPYYSINEDQKVYLSKSDLLGLLQKPAIYYQEKHLFKYEMNEFDEIKIKSLNDQFLVKKPFKKEKTLELINKLKGMTVQSYLEKDEISLENPILEVELSSSLLKWSFQLSLSQKQKKLFAKVKTPQEFFVEYDTSYWEYFANLKKESL